MFTVVPSKSKRANFQWMIYLFVNAAIAESVGNYFSAAICIMKALYLVKVIYG